MKARLTTQPCLSSTGMDAVGFLGFDTFGTVVDLLSGVAKAATSFLDRHGIDVDQLAVADEWRSLYQPAMEEVRSGKGPWVRLEVLNGKNRRAILIRHGVQIRSISEAELAELNRTWERLSPRPDSVEDPTRLRVRDKTG